MQQVFFVFDNLFIKKPITKAKKRLYFLLFLKKQIYLIKCSCKGKYIFLNNNFYLVITNLWLLYCLNHT